jgi:hypothetical protein
LAIALLTLLTPLSSSYSFIVVDIPMSDSEEDHNQDGSVMTTMKTSSNVEPAGRFRDEEKQARKMAKRFKDIITQVNEFHAVILDNPELWFTPELQQTRQFVEKINQDPSHLFSLHHAARCLILVGGI